MADRTDWWERARRDYAAEAGVTEELIRRGIPAEFWHSGGGIFTVRIEQGVYEWQFGTADGDWGWDYSHREHGHVESGNLDLDGATPALAVAGTIAERISDPPEPPG